MDATPAREPILNVPPVVVVTLGAIGLVHAVRALILSQRADLEFLLLFAFIPARYEPSILPTCRRSFCNGSP